MEKFSQLYLRQNILSSDSKRARKRVSSYFAKECEDNKLAFEIFKEIEIETGAHIQFEYGGFNYSISEFLKKCETRDFLDSIVIISKILSKPIGFARNKFPQWRDFIENVFKEEELRYVINKKGEVHYFIDEDFEKTYQSTILALNNSQYKLAEEAYRKAIKNLTSLNQDWNASLKYVFDSAEIIFKEITGKKRLSSTLLDDDVIKKFNEDHDNNPVYKYRMNQFKAWIDALHNYRHGQTDEKISTITEELVAFYITSGSAFIRWLVMIPRENVSIIHPSLHK